MTLGFSRAARKRGSRFAAFGAAAALAFSGVAATSLLALGGAVVTASPANAIYCPPGFETLPGCSTGGGGSTPGSGSPDAPGTWTTESIAGMNVRIYTPTTAAHFESGRALMINLHGCAQKAADLQSNGNWTATAEQYGMIVALPDAPNGGVILGCWDYYDSNHSRAFPSRHDDNLLDLAAALTARSSLGIDANQVYLSGLSSGGAQTMVMGCLAPDVFAGIGINAGPTVGTTSGQIGSVATNLNTGKNTCLGFANSAAPSFDTQLTSVVFGNSDHTVAQGYGTLNGQIMASIYGANTTSSFSLNGLAGQNTAGSGSLYSDADGPRVSVINNSGLGHAWPAGAGLGGTYISSNSIDYPAYVTSFFFENNRRVDSSAVAPDPEPDPEPTPEPDPDPTTEPEPDPEPDPEPTVCFTATNAEHKSEGRAVSYGVNPYNPYYAIGSLAYLGNGDATVTSLQVSGTTYVLVTTCN